MAKPESEFTTIEDMHLVLAELVGQGLGALPVQLLVAPDSTIQALARHAGVANDAKPALMLEFNGRDGRIGPSVISAARLRDGSARVLFNDRSKS